MWCINAPNYKNIVEIFNDNNVTGSQLFIYISVLIKGVSPAVSTVLCCPLCWLIDFFFFSLLSALAVGDRCWVLLSVARRVGSRDQVQHFSNALMDIGTAGSQRTRLFSASASQRKSWEGECQPVLLYLLWEDCDNSLWIAFLLLSSKSSFTTPHFLIFKKQFCRLSFSFQTGLTGTSASSFHSHPACKKRRWCLCTQREHTVVKMEWKRKCRGGNEISSWPYLASAHNTSRRCKWDK